jgi:hypothetical protein
VAASCTPRPGNASAVVLVTGSAGFIGAGPAISGSTRGVCSAAAPAAGLNR